jgi:hypothetical protein
MRFMQKKVIGVKTEAIIRYVCAVVSTLASILFAMIFIGLFIEGIHENTFPDVLLALSIFSFLAAFTFYILWGLWQEGRSTPTQKIITKLQLLD